MKKIKNISLWLFIVLIIIFNLLILNKPITAKEPVSCKMAKDKLCNLVGGIYPDEWDERN